jgi:hypothetical protein
MYIMNTAHDLRHMCKPTYILCGEAHVIHGVLVGRVVRRRAIVHERHEHGDGYVGEATRHPLLAVEGGVLGSGDDA